MNNDDIQEQIRLFFSCKTPCSGLKIPNCEKLLSKYCGEILSQGHPHFAKLGISPPKNTPKKGCSRCKKNALRRKYKNIITKLLNDTK